ncbi:hypothetical protein ACFVXE_19925 [Streptomyces sp. NPDC058231]|uniref:AMIN-like domain-containing (lipo)protein n=1 Tax=unclassified Streptomyces TaxID=2593676 RepID=UPI0036EC18CF
MAGLTLAGVVPAQAADTAAVAPACASVCFLDARTGAHPDYDRLVLDLTETGYPQVTATVSPDGLYVMPSGDTKYMTIPGNSYLLLDMGGADATTYTSPSTLNVALPSLKGVQLLQGWYEGHAEFGLSLGDYSQYKISHLTAPNRMVIDIYH